MCVRVSGINRTINQIMTTWRGAEIMTEMLLSAAKGPEPVALFALFEPEKLLSSPETLDHFWLASKFVWVFYVININIITRETTQVFCVAQAGRGRPCVYT